MDKEKIILYIRCTGLIICYGTYILFLIWSYFYDRNLFYVMLSIIIIAVVSVTLFSYIYNIYKTKIDKKLSFDERYG